MKNTIMAMLLTCTLLSLPVYSYHTVYQSKPAPKAAVTVPKAVVTVPKAAVAVPGPQKATPPKGIATEKFGGQPQSQSAVQKDYWQ